ncbi:MAG: c-type cytochrome [Chloroflexi bacterium]|nr:c-type cytochrome [Chloroflexota bacterium]
MTFYVMAYHWDYAIFTAEGARIDTIAVPEGTTIEILAMHALAQNAIDRLPAPVAQAMREVPHPDAAAILAAEPEPQWSVEDHGLLLDSYHVIEYLAADAREPNRAVFTADKPGEYAFVCTNYCGAGHSAMSARIRLVVQSAGLVSATPTPTPERAGAPPDNGAEFGRKIFTGDAGVVNPPCSVCHAVGRAGVGPDLAGVATRAATRVEGLTAADYLRQKVLDPRANPVARYPAIMPSFQGQMTDDQLKALIAYLMTLE